ncbi:MAG: serine/threonine-protein kinase [Planctomycetota bacterium]|nr:serine/threonine-protein kinase [Planctomycetota bacterium]
MFCTECGQPNQDGAKFCHACGKPLPRGSAAGNLIASATQLPMLPDTGTVSSAPTPGSSSAGLKQAGGTVWIESLVPGQVLAGRYEIQQRLGAGGMGQVWQAHDRELDLAVALKVLPPVLAGNSRAVAALKREAALSLRLTHTNICRLYTFHSDGDLGFLVMELILGRTLEQLQDERPERRMTLPELLPIFGAVAEAVDFAHRQTPPILHRDIKPANIMVAQPGGVKVLDFGIACEIRNTMTRMTGQASAGTLLYMSPEQFHGDRLSPASDLSALAATLYECLAGHPHRAASLHPRSPAGRRLLVHGHTAHVHGPGPIATRRNLCHQDEHGRVVLPLRRNFADQDQPRPIVSVTEPVGGLNVPPHFLTRRHESTASHPPLVLGPLSTYCGHTLSSVHGGLQARRYSSLPGRPSCDIIRQFHRLEHAAKEIG